MSKNNGSSAFCSQEESSKTILEKCLVSRLTDPYANFYRRPDLKICTFAHAGPERRFVYDGDKKTKETASTVSCNVVVKEVQLN
jgi:hypothetical protein